MSETSKAVSGWVPASAKMAFPEGMVDAFAAFAHPDAPGLAVTRDGHFSGWSVTHLASGHAIGTTDCVFRIALREDAERFALALAPLTDWMRGMDELLADRPTLSPKVHAARVAVFGSCTWDDSDDEEAPTPPAAPVSAPATEEARDA